MIVALLQIRLDAKSRSRNVQNLMAAIDKASEATPAPDLLVLPGACDTGGANPLRRDRQTNQHASLAAVSEMVASKAREWGVFVAVGLHVRKDDAWVPAACIFDPDGDVVARSLATDDVEETGSTCEIPVWTSAVGDVGVVESSLADRRLDQLAVDKRGTVVALPVADGIVSKGRVAANTVVERLRSGTLVSGGAHWAVVCKADEPNGESRLEEPGTFLGAADGTILVKAITSAEAVLYAEVPIEPGAS